MGQLSSHMTHLSFRLVRAATFRHRTARIRFFRVSWCEFVDRLSKSNDHEATRNNTKRHESQKEMKSRKWE